MTPVRKITWILSAMVAILFLPWIGAYIHHHFDFPTGYFNYPPLHAGTKVGYVAWVYWLLVAILIFLSVLYFFPKVFGFKKVPVQPTEQKKVNFPSWFYFGIICWGTALFLYWTKATKPAWLLHWGDLPLFWGFTIMLDGIVYKRNSGKSMISKLPQELVGIGVASISGWMIFEYLNFFVDDNWYYPFGNIIDREEFLLYACTISSGLMPMAFMFYELFKTYPKFSVRFSDGLKVIFPVWIKNGIIIISLLGLFLSGLFPDELFFSLWVTPLTLLAGVLDRCGVWTPFKSIGSGNWTPTLLSALTYLAAGFVLECQNYFSATRDAAGNVISTMDPVFWQYSLPYVNVHHIFEMPYLGYLGYLPFGIFCWIWWIAFASLLGLPSRYFQENPHNES